MGRVFKALAKSGKLDSSHLESRKERRVAVEERPEDLSSQPVHTPVVEKKRAEHTSPESVPDLGSLTESVEKLEKEDGGETVVVEQDRPAPESPAAEPARQERAAEKHFPAGEEDAEPQIPSSKQQPETEPVARPTRIVPGQEMDRGHWDERLDKAIASTSAVFESFRHLRTRILHPSSGKPPRSLLITSATPGEGKSFICANLAHCLSQEVQQHSLMVDCDLRRPSLHEIFGLPNKAGLVNYLRDHAELKDLIIPTGISKLSMLPGGPPPINPSELLGSGVMVELVHELERRYDDRTILLDSPPLHAAAETAILAQHVDGVVLVVRWGGSRREHVKRLLETVGKEKIVAVVFNAYKSGFLDTKVFGNYEIHHDYYLESKKKKAVKKNK